MEKLITIHPFKGECGEFKNFIENICSHIQHEDEKFKEYIKFCNLKIKSLSEFQNLDFMNLYKNIQKKINLWIIKPEDFGIKEIKLYSDFIDIMGNENFIPAPRLSVFCLPIILKEQNIFLTEGVRILKPIRPIRGEFHKSKGISIRMKKSEIHIKTFSLMPTDYNLNPKEKFIVQKL